MARHYLELSKGVEKKMKIDQSPLRQFYELPKEVLRQIEDRKATPEILLDMGIREVGSLVRNQKLASRVLYLAARLPHLYITHSVQPITRNILRIHLYVSCDFTWSSQFHGPAESFHIWMEDGQTEAIYHSEYFMISKKQYDNEEECIVEFTVPIRDPLPPQYYIRCISDRWVGCESCLTVSFQHLILPDRMPPHTDLLDIHPVSLSITLHYSLIITITPHSSLSPLRL